MLNLKLSAFLMIFLLLICCCLLRVSSHKGKPASLKPGAGDLLAAIPRGASEPRRSLECRKVPGTIVLDGRIEEWQSADTLRLDDPAVVSDPNQVKIYTLWDARYLYIAYEVKDRYLVGYQTRRDHRALYKDDMIEVLLDPRKDAGQLWLEDDIVYHINVLCQVKDDRGTPQGISDATWQSDALFAVSYQGSLNFSNDRDVGFNVELAVPWSEIGLKPAPGVTLGINFAAGDAEGLDEHLWDWCGAHPFRQPSAYGLLRLK